MRKCLFFCFWCDSPQWARASSCTMFLDHTQWRTTVSRTSLDEWSHHCRDLYLTTHNTHNRQTSMPLVGFKPTISAGERLQTYALDRVATGTGYFMRKYRVYLLLLRDWLIDSGFPLKLPRAFHSTSTFFVSQHTPQQPVNTLRPCLVHSATHHHWHITPSVLHAHFYNTLYPSVAALLDC